MKKLLILFLIPLLFNNCKKDKDETQNNWVTSYSSINLGAQTNHTVGHFFKPQTGQVIAVENTAGQEYFLSLMFYTTASGTYTYLTFPADRGPSNVNTDNIRLFTQDPGGVDTWPSTSLVGGFINKASGMTSINYDNMVNSLSWVNFDKVFKDNNNNDEYLSYKKGYVDAKVGDVYLTQFNGLVRAIICVRNVVATGASAGISFDIVVESRESYINSASAQYIQPLEE